MTDRQQVQKLKKIGNKIWEEKVMDLFHLTSDGLLFGSRQNYVFKFCHIIAFTKQDQLKRGGVLISQLVPCRTQHRCSLLALLLIWVKREPIQVRFMP